MAGKSTLNRMKLKARKGKDGKYKKIDADFSSLEDFFIREYVRTVKKNTREVVFDPDNTRGGGGAG